MKLKERQSESISSYHLEAKIANISWIKLKIVRRLSTEEISDSNGGKQYGGLLNGGNERKYELQINLSSK